MESEAGPYIGMLMAECCQVGLMIISKQVMSTPGNNMSTFVFVCYSNALASLILLPFSFFFHRSERPPLTFSLLGWFFLLALSGCLAQLFGYTGINYSSPTLGTAMLNLVPGITFLLAIIFSGCLPSPVFLKEQLSGCILVGLAPLSCTRVLLESSWTLRIIWAAHFLYFLAKSLSISPPRLRIGYTTVAFVCFISTWQCFIDAEVLRMEKLNFKHLTFQAKLMGTIVLIAGAFIVTLYDGPPLLNGHVALHTHQLSILGEQMKWILGGSFLAVDCVMAASWNIIQAVILKKYPAELIVVFFYCFFITIQSGIVTFIVERDPSAWSLKPTLRLLAVLYSGFFGSALQVGLCSWCLRRKGPVFVCMFKPLGIAIAAIAGVVFFGDTLYLGSLLGIIVIALGFYSVMWGKAKEVEKSHAGQFGGSLGSISQKVPLLANYPKETQNSAA